MSCWTSGGVCLLVRGVRFFLSFFSQCSLWLLFACYAFDWCGGWFCCAQCGCPVVCLVIIQNTQEKLQPFYVTVSLYRIGTAHAHTLAPLH